MKTTRTFYVLLIALVMNVSAFAQLPGDTVLLKDVTIVASKKILLSEEVVSDSLMELYYKQATLSELLNTFSGLSIRQYGLGGSATVSPHGYTPSQIAVKWNGVNLTNPMLGQFDLSLLPAFLFDDLILNEQANGLDNAPAGSLELSEKFPHQGVSIQSHHSWSTLNNLSNAVGVKSNRNRVSTSINFYDTRNENVFWYRNPALLNELVKHEHAKSESLGGTAGFKYVVGKNSIRLGGLYSTTEREVPPTMLQSHNYSEQDDRTAVGFIRYERLGTTSYLIKSSVSQNFIHYVDTFSKIEDRSTSDVYEAAINVGRKLFGIEWSGRLKTDYTKAKVLPDVYDVEEWLHGVELSATKSFESLRLKVEAEGSQRLLKNNFQPINYAATISYQPVHVLTLILSHALASRLPTLNERFWQPGGNPDLKPELAMRNSLRIESEIKNDLVEISCNTYYDLVDNWIQWTPGDNGIWSPKNIKSVLLYGVEPSLTNTIRYKKVKSSLSLRYNLNYAITQSSLTLNDESVGKQLMYVPQQTFHAHEELSSRVYSLLVVFNYLGKRFTSTDQSSQLEPFYTLDCGLSRKFLLKRFTISTTVKFENATGTDYQSVAWRPMPKQVFTFSLNLQYNHKL